jgi:phospholipid/cholesterol/gamma-HCH transport system substrate-binding protein
MRISAISQTLANLDELSSHLAANKASLDLPYRAYATPPTNSLRRRQHQPGRHPRRGQHRWRWQNADAALKEAIVALGSLQRDASLISERVQQFAETGTLELTNVSRDMRAGADTLTTAGQRLSNPRAILFGPGQQQLGPGEKLP